MLDDAYFDIIGFISAKIGEAFGLGLNDAYINGDGNGKPQGILSHPNYSVAHASGGMKILSGASGAVAWGSSTTGLLGTEAALPPQYESGAAWYANKATIAAIRAINAGTATLPQWSTGDSYPNFSNGYNPNLLGFPVRKDQFVPDISTSNYPVIFGDLKGYYAPQRSGITVEVLREVRALRGEVVIYARQRVGGQLVEDYRVKVMKSHNS
jgi:HK97 family phage major capsid protein